MTYKSPIVSTETMKLIWKSKKEIAMETTTPISPASKFGELIQLVEDCRVDYAKSMTGNRASSTRVRNNMTKIKILALAIRKEMLEARKK